MTSALMLSIVMLATFGLAALVLAGVVALVWYWGLGQTRTAPADLLALRLLPVAGALLLVLTIVLPAFLSHEPHQDRETVGPWVLILAAFALLTLGHGIGRGWRAWTAARSLLRACGAPKRCIVENGHSVQIVDVATPLIGVIGGWRPRLVTAECVISACSPDEFRQVVAHEAAHLRARDNLKLLLLIVCPDALAWTPLGAVLTERWRAEAEFAADRHATGDDPHRRVELASALVKVARQFGSSAGPRNALTMAIASDDVEGRVRQLLAPAEIPPASMIRTLAYSALLIPLATLPLYGFVHQLIETLVRFGR